MASNERTSLLGLIASVMLSAVADVTMIDPRKLAKRTLNAMLRNLQRQAADDIARLRRVHPDKAPAELIDILNKEYVRNVLARGAGAGMVAAFPNKALKTMALLAGSYTFLEASALYVQSVAEIHGMSREDFETRNDLVTAVLIGNSATMAATPLTSHTAPYWAKRAVTAIPMSMIDKANNVLGPNFITKSGTVKGKIVLGQVMPRALGGVIGGGANTLAASAVIAATGKILGPPPQVWTTAAVVLDYDLNTLADR